jgi:hypothetical protein
MARHGSRHEAHHMMNVPIQSLPNQTFSISLENNTYDITLKETNGVISATVVRNDIIIVENQRCVAGFPVIPYEYLEDGNFIFFTQDEQLPDYTQFNATQSFNYITALELAAFRVPPIASSPAVPTVTATFFNPLGALPLRFQPVGYIAL